MIKIKAAIIVGSDSDLPVIASTVKILKEFDVQFRLSIASAHRTPEKVRKFVKESEKSGAEVFIAAAGMSAALPGVVASETTLPVIGIPMEGKSLLAFDSLLSIVQMPPGIPVAAVSVGRPGAINAGLLAVEILSLKYPAFKKKIHDYRKKTLFEIEKKDARLQVSGLEKYIKEMK